MDKPLVNLKLMRPSASQDGFKDGDHKKMPLTTLRLSMVSEMFKEDPKSSFKYKNAHQFPSLETDLLPIDFLERLLQYHLPLTVSPPSLSKLTLMMRELLKPLPLKPQQLLPPALPNQKIQNQQMETNQQMEINQQMEKSQNQKVLNEHLYDQY